jgi:uncharacterized protein (TIGR00297 family)
VLAGTALAFNLYALPRIGGTRLYRADEGKRRYYSGITLYPAAVLVLILMLPDRPDIVASAWGVLAVGDGMATVVGRRLRSPRIPWNRDKSVAGSLSLFIFGGAAAAFLCWWCRPVIVPPPFVWFSIGAPFAAALLAAAVETIPVRLDDNVSVPATAAAVLWWLSLISTDMVLAAASAFAPALPLAAAVDVIVALAGYLARTVSLSGAIAGTLLGIVIMLSAGWAGWALLIATFACAVVVSKMGLRRKMLLGIAEPHGGRRGAGNAFANTGVAAAAALLSVVSYAAGPALIAFVAALVAGGSDTVASEIGKAWGRRTYLFPSLRPVAPGTPGAISLEGTVAGVGGATALGGLGVMWGLIPPSALLPVIVGATIGAFAESLLGATLEPHGFVNNDILNFLNTAIAAAAAVALAQGLA